MEDTVSELLDARPPRRGRRLRAPRHAPRGRPRRARARRHGAAAAGTRRHHPRVRRPRARPPRAVGARRAQPARQRGPPRHELGGRRARAGDDHTVELTVDDDGPGIPVEDRERVFDRFTRLDDGRARDAGGLGLGLSMVKAIAEQHGGTVDDRGRPDRRGPPARTAPRGLTPYGASMPELTIASFNCHAGLQARRNGVCEPYDLDTVLRGHRRRRHRAAGVVDPRRWRGRGPARG